MTVKNTVEKRWKFRVSDIIGIGVIIGFLFNIAAVGWFLKGYDSRISITEKKIVALEKCTDSIQDTQNDVDVLKTWINKNDNLPLTMVRLTTQMSQLTDEIKQVKSILMLALHDVTYRELE